MATERRSVATRENKKNKVAWAPPSRLDTPQAPDGFKFRWIRRTAPGTPNDDVQNLLSREKQKYEIVTGDMLSQYGGTPEMYQTLDSGKHSGAVINGDLVLTMVPEEIAEERTSYYEKRSQMQLDAVREQLKQNQNPVMPITDSSRSTTKVGQHSFED